MFERPQGGNRAILVVLDTGDADREHRQSELSALAVSAGARNSARNADLNEMKAALARIARCDVILRLA